MVILVCSSPEIIAWLPSRVQHHLAPTIEHWPSPRPTRSTTSPTPQQSSPFITSRPLCDLCEVIRRARSLDRQRLNHLQLDQRSVLLPLLCVARIDLARAVDIILSEIGHMCPFSTGVMLPSNFLGTYF